MYLYGAHQATAITTTAAAATSLCMQCTWPNDLALVMRKITKYQLTNAIMMDCYPNTIKTNQYGMR